MRIFLFILVLVLFFLVREYFEKVDIPLKLYLYFAGEVYSWFAGVFLWFAEVYSWFAEVFSWFAEVFSWFEKVFSWFEKVFSKFENTFIVRSVLLPIFTTAVGAGVIYFFSSVRKKYIGEEAREKFAKGLEAYKRKNYSKAIQIWRPLADINHGTAKGLTGSFIFFSSKLRKGDAEAQYYMGKMYDKGFGVIQDQDIALEWYKKAAGQGHAKSQNHLGFIYQIGGNEYKKQGKEYKDKGKKYKAKVEENKANKEYKKAIPWYRKAAVQGNAKGQNNLGFMYMKGLGVGENYRIAFDWYKKAAEQASPDAQNNIAYMHDEGMLEDKKPGHKKEAVKWYRQSAKQGGARGQTNLAIMYKNGEGGLTQNNIHAYKWFYLAKENKDEDAIQALKDLEKIMDKKDVDKAKKLAKKCRDSHYEDCGE